MPSIDDELHAAVSSSPLPGGFHVAAVRASRGPTGSVRVRFDLRRADEEAPSLVLDASTDASAAHAPFVAEPWRLTYRATPIPFSEFSDVGAAVASRLERALPSASWSEHAPLASSERRTSGPGGSWFVTESVLLEGLVRGAREAVEHAIEARVAARSGTSGAVSTLLYLAGACAQRCAFCTVPHERDAGHAQKTPAVALVASGAFDALLGALARRRGSTITLVGDDWAAHPEIDEILDRLARSSVRSSLLGPGTALARPELAGKVAGIASLDRVTVTLEASPETEAGRGIHDAIVGRAGAAVLVHEGIRRLRALGTVVEVAHVLTRESIGALPDLAEHCARHALPLSIAGFVPDRTHVPTFRPEAIIARMDEVRSALALAHERADGAIERVTGLPVCAVPSELASKLSSRWDSGDTEAWTKPTRGPCADCPASPQCVGVPTAYVRAHGAEGLARTDAPHRP